MTAIGRSDKIEHQQELVLARGRNEIEWHVAVEEPDLWWPFALGDQPLYDTDVAVVIAGELSDKISSYRAAKFRAS